jgi:hypothetical protein
MAARTPGQDIRTALSLRLCQPLRTKKPRFGPEATDVQAKLRQKEGASGTPYLLRLPFGLVRSDQWASALLPLHATAAAPACSVFSSRFLLVLIRDVLAHAAR